MTYTSNDRGEVDRDGKLYAMSFGAPTSIDQIARAERIAACLNFCEGFNTEQLEGVSMKTLVNVLENFMKIKERAEIPVVLEMTKGVLAKLKATSVKS